MEWAGTETEPTTLAQLFACVCRGLRARCLRLLLASTLIMTGAMMMDVCTFSHSVTPLERCVRACILHDVRNIDDQEKPVHTNSWRGKGTGSCSLYLLFAACCSASGAEDGCLRLRLRLLGWGGRYTNHCF